MARRHYINNAAVTTLTGSLTNIATSFAVADLSTYPASFPYTIVIDPGLTTAEVILVTAATGNTVTACTRGYDGTSAQSHAASAQVEHVAVQMDYDEANSHNNASSAVHGIAGSVVGTTDTQTLSGKTLSSPAFTGTATGNLTTTGNVQGAVVTATGNASVGGTLAVTGTSSHTGNATFGGTVAASGQITAPSKVAPNEIAQINFTDQLANLGNSQTWVFNAAAIDINTLGVAAQGSPGSYALIVIPAGKTGKYRVSGKVSVNTTSGRITAGLTDNNGAWLLAASIPSATTGITQVTFGPKVLSLTAGSQYKVQVNPTQAGNFDILQGTANDCYVLLERIA